jgi:hypothetical protein
MTETLEVRQLQSDREKMIINSWWKAWGYTGMPEDSYPPHTYVAYFDNVPAVSGCMYLTDSKVIFLESFISNKGISKEARRLAMSALIKKMASKGKELGFKTWSATTKFEHMLDTSKQINVLFAAQGYYYLTGNL